jgi:hypothetical protein
MRISAITVPYYTNFTARKNLPVRKISGDVVNIDMTYKNLKELPETIPAGIIATTTKNLLPIKDYFDANYVYRTKESHFTLGECSTIINTRTGKPANIAASFGDVTIEDYGEVGDITRGNGKFHYPGDKTLPFNSKEDIDVVLKSEASAGKIEADCVKLRPGAQASNIKAKTIADIRKECITGNIDSRIIKLNNPERVGTLSFKEYLVLVEDTKISTDILCVPYMPSGNFIYLQPGTSLGNSKIYLQKDLYIGAPDKKLQKMQCVMLNFLMLKQRKKSHRIGNSLPA